VRAPVKKLEPLHTVAETAKILNVSEKTVRRRIDDGLLRAIRLRGDDDRRGPRAGCAGRSRGLYP
jgi:excisionase family DNA binding protein